MSKRYDNPPIVEALCEFRFVPEGEWDLTIPGLIYERLKADFPIRRQARVFTVALSAEQDDFEHQVRSTGRMQFFQEDEKALVQIEPYLLAVNHLAPYSSWEKFKPLIAEGFAAYKSVIPNYQLQRIGLRYINRIEVPNSDQPLELKKYFEFYPYVGSVLPKTHIAFFVGIQSQYEDGRDIMKLDLTNAPSTNGNEAALLLDLDYFLAQPEKFKDTDVFNWIETAHNSVENLFEAAIKDPLRLIFGEQK